MKRLKMSILTCMLAMALTIPVFIAAPVAAAALTCGTWSIVSSPSPGARSNALLAVAAVATDDIWAVGNTANNSSPMQTLIEHWDGSSWTVVSSPNGGPGNNTLFSVSAVSASDIWAVGDHSDAQTLIEHWDGTSWTVVSSPSGSSQSFLLGVSAISANNVWAVGTSNFPGSPQTLIEHWDGTSWTIVSSQNVAGSSQNLLTGVSAFNKNHAWAVGYYLNGNTGSYQTLAEQWDGSSWTIVPSPNSGSGNNFLYGVAPGPGNGNYWTVGIGSGSSGAQTLAERWDGTSWNIVPSPNVGTSGNQFNAVAAVSGSNAWAVGAYGSGQTLIEQWDGTSWNVVSSPNVGSSGNSLYGIAQAPHTKNLWAVGFSTNAQQTLIEYLC